MPVGPCALISVLCVLGLTFSRVACVAWDGAHIPLTQIANVTEHKACMQQAIRDELHLRLMHVGLRGPSHLLMALDRMRTPRSIRASRSSCEMKSFVSAYIRDEPLITG